MERFTKLGILSLAALVALGACSKGTSTTTTTTTDQGASAAPSDNAMSNAASPGAASSPAGGAMAGAAGNGSKVYQTNCSSCHQANGQGVAGTFPPLAGNPVVRGDASKVIHIVKYGLNGKVEVKGTTYNGMMPAWGQQLSNGDIASVISFIRSSWGNTGSAVTESQVAAVKK